MSRPVDSRPPDPDMHYMDCGIAGGMPHPASAHEETLYDKVFKTIGSFHLDINIRTLADITEAVMEVINTKDVK